MLRGAHGGAGGVDLAVEALSQRVLELGELELRGLDLIERADFFRGLSGTLTVEFAFGGRRVEGGEDLVGRDALADLRVERDDGPRLRRGERDLADGCDRARGGHGLRDVLRRDGRDIGGGEHHAVGADGEVVGAATARSEDGEGGGGEGDSLLFHYSWIVVVPISLSIITVNLAPASLRGVQLLVPSPVSHSMAMGVFFGR